MCGQLWTLCTFFGNENILLCCPNRTITQYIPWQYSIIVLGLLQHKDVSLVRDLLWRGTKQRPCKFSSIHKPLAVGFWGKIPVCETFIFPSHDDVISGWHIYSRVREGKLLTDLITQNKRRAKYFKRDTFATIMHFISSLRAAWEISVWGQMHMYDCTVTWIFMRLWEMYYLFWNIVYCVGMSLRFLWKPTPMF